MDETGEKRIRSRQWSEVEARAVLEAQRQSGLGLAEYAKQQGLDDGRLYRWRQKLTQRSAEKTAPGFVAVKLRGPSQTSALELVLPGGQVVRLKSDFCDKALRRLLSALTQTAT